MEMNKAYDFLSKILFGKKFVNSKNEAIRLTEDARQKIDKAEQLYSEAESLRKKIYSDATQSNFDSKKLEELENQIKEQLLQVKSIHIIADEKINYSEKKITRRYLLFSIMNPALTVLSLIIILHTKPYYHSSISINYYIALAQIIPVFIIAWSVNELSRQNTRIEYFAALIGLSPALAAEVACLYSIAQNQSLNWTLYLSITGAAQIVIFFILSGFFSEDVRYSRGRF
jgi:cation transport ATPase